MTDHRTVELGIRTSSVPSQHHEPPSLEGNGSGAFTYSPSSRTPPPGTGRHRSLLP